MEPKKFVDYPNCFLCRGKRKINYLGYIAIECPACNYENWKEHDAIDVKLDLIEAKKIREGIIQISVSKYETWRNIDDTWHEKKTKAIKEKNEIKKPRRKIQKRRRTKRKKRIIK